MADGLFKRSLEEYQQKSILRNKENVVLPGYFSDLVILNFAGNKSEIEKLTVDFPTKTYVVNISNPGGLC